MTTELKFDDTLVCHKCDYLGKDKSTPKIVMPAEMWKQWEIATHVYPQWEILALFKVNDQGVMTELCIPPQEIEGGSCMLKEQEGHWDGMLHSHHSMGAKFSSMDDATVLPNYRYSIVTNHAGGSDAVERIELPCGGIGFKPLKVEVEGLHDDMGVTEVVKAMCETPADRAAKASTKYMPGNYLVHPMVCTCVICQERKKGNSNGGYGDTPFGIATTGGDGRGNHLALQDRRFSTAELLPSKRDRKRKEREARKWERKEGGKHDRTPLIDTPRVLKCRECTHTIFTTMDDWGTDERGNPLCKRCWDTEYSQYAGV